MKRARRLLVALGMFAMLAPPTLGADYSVVPISASGAHTIAGNQITLTGGGQTVTLEIRIGSWDPVPDVGICFNQSLCSIAAQACASGPCRGTNGLLSTLAACSSQALVVRHAGLGLR